MRLQNIPVCARKIAKNVDENLLERLQILSTYQNIVTILKDLGNEHSLSIRKRS